MIDSFENWLLRNFDENGRAYAAQLAGRASRAFLGMFTLAGTITFIGVTFRSLVAPQVLTLWLCATTIVIAQPIFATAAFAIHGPRTERAIHPYLIWSRIATFSLSALIAASVWILLPHASLPLQYVMLILYVTYVAMILGADVSAAVMTEQVAVMASTIAFVLVYRLPYAVPLAIVLSAVTISLGGFHRLSYRATQAAIDARAESERANAALEVALADIARQRDAKTRFIAAASHDLRQPVQAAALYFEHALSGPDPHLRARAIEGARRAFASVDALLETMLEHLRFEAGAAKPRIEPVAVNAIFADVLGQQTPVANAANMKLILMPCRLTVSADVTMLSRVLGNVVGNAIRHSSARRVLVGARPAGEILSIWVIDDGCGVSAADVPRLFEEYMQGSGPATAPGGFGIGLASSRRMMQLMSGDIALDPRWKAGAAFCLRLPLARSAREVPLWKAA